jgi:hypothetical protein
MFDEARLRLIDNAIRAKQAASPPHPRAPTVPVVRQAVPHRGRIIAGALAARALLVIARRWSAS